MQAERKTKQQDGDIEDGNLRTWRQVGLQTVRDLWTSNVLEWAASLAFYGLLSLFPLLIASMILASYIVDVAWATEQAVGLLGQFLPEGEAHIEEIVTTAITQRRRVGLLSFFMVLLTGRRILGGLIKGLNHVSDVAELADTIKRKVGIELALVVGIIALVGLALASRQLVDLLWDTMRLVPGPDGLAVQGVTALVRIALLLAIFTLVYAFVPQGDRVWRAVVTGASLATALYLVAQVMFSLFLDMIWTNLTLVYGPLALAALLLTWCWYVALITLIGAGFASHVKTMVIERRGAEQTRERHAAT